MKKFIGVIISYFILSSMVACGQSQPSVQNSDLMTEAAISSSANTSKVTQISPTQTPVAVPANTPSPTTTAVSQLGSSELPIPFNTPIGLIKDNNKELTMEVKEVRRGQDAWNMLYSADPSIRQPPSNMEWMCALVHMEYKSGPSNEPIELAVYMFETVSNGKILNINYYVSPQPGFNISVLPGEAGEGWVCGHLIKNGTNPMLLFAHTDGTSGWYFSLTP